MSTCAVEPVQIGNELFVIGTFKDKDGVLANPTVVKFMYSPLGPAEQVTITYDGMDPRIVRLSTGVYEARVTPLAAGNWSVGFRGTGNETTVFKEEHIKVLATTLEPEA